MANTIIHKRSNVSDSIPTSSQLTLGELALNTADGKVYMKKGNGEIIDVSYQQDRVRGEFSGGTGVTYNDITGVISIGQPVNQTSNVQFASANIANALNIGGETTFGGDISVDGSAVINGTLDVAGNTVINGNLTVNGSTTTLNSTELTVDDIHVVLGSTASPTNATANGGGIILKGTTDKSILWDSINANWTSTENWNIVTGKVYKINNIPVLTSNQVFPGQDSISIAPNATQINIGSATGLTTINTDVKIDGDLEVTGITSSTGTTTVDSDLIVQGNLTVNGATTTLNSTILTVDDINIVLGSTLAPSNSSANGGGIILKGTTDKSIIWDNTNANWTSSEHWNIANTKTYKIDNIEVLSSNQLFNGNQTNVILAPSATSLTAGATTGTLTLRNPTIVGSNTTQSLFNTVATTVNAFGAGTNVVLSATTGTTRIRNNLIVDGTIDFGSTGEVAGDMTLSGDLQVNGCDITTTCPTFNLINTTSTAVNFAGAATAIEIGATIGTTNIHHNLLVDGHTILNSTLNVVDNTTFQSDVDIQGSLNVDGNITLGGNITIGDQTLDTINVVADFTSNLIPDVTNTYDLGSSTKRWNYLYANNLDVSGNSSLVGNMTLGGDLAVDGCDITTTCSTFNLINTNATTVNAFGAGTDVILSATTGTTRIRNNLIVDGTIDFGSTGEVAGDMTLSGDLAVNGCDITTTCPTFNLINTNATTVNFAGAATSVEIGASSGTTHIKNNLDVEGTIYVSAITSDDDDANLSITANNYITIDSNTNGQIEIGRYSGVGRVILGSAVTGVTLGAAGGDVDILGNTLDIDVISTTITGDLAVNGCDITTTCSTFNLINTDATTVNAFGAGTNVVLSATTGTTRIRNNLIVDGTIDFGSTGEVAGDMTLSGDLAVNGCDITTTCPTFNLINTNATTVNFAGAATSIEIGAATGTTNINHDLDVDGNTILNGTLGVDGNTTLSGTLAVIGNTTLTGDLAVNGCDITTTCPTFNLVNTTSTAVNFAGAATSIEIGASTGTTNINHNLLVDGNTTLSGTLAVTGNTTLTGDLAVNGGDITTTANTFNLLNSNATTITAFGAGTNVTLSATTGTTTIKNNLIVEGTVSFGSTGSLTDDLTLSGDLTVNGCDIKTTCTAFNLINTNAASVNFAGAGTAISIGSSTGDTTINNNLIVSGNLTVSGTTTTVNTETINLADNIITLNSNATGAPSENAGIEVVRGSSSIVGLRWNESSDKWEATRDGSTYVVLPINTAELAEDPSATVTSGTMYYTNARARNSISVNDASGDGSLTYDSATGVITYTGPSAAEVRAHLSVTDAGGDGSLSYDSATGVITYTGPSAAEVRAHLSVTDTGGDGSLTYDNATGVITYTGPSATEVRSHFTAGTGVSINSGQISIGQSVGTTDTVTFNKVNVGTAGIAFPENAYGGGADTATITLTSAGGENTRMTFTMTNDAEDKFNFVTLSNNGLLMNGNTVWHAGNDGSGSGLDADLLDGLNQTSANTASTIVARDASGNFSAGTITAALSGNSSTSTTLQTARNINGTSFDGSADITFYDVFTSGVASPGPQTFTSNTVRGFDAYGSTDFPGTFYAGITVTGAGGVKSGQLAMNWNSDESGPSGLYFRTNDDTGTTAAWSAWTKIWNENNDGTGSGLDADLLDGYDSTHFKTTSNISEGTNLYYTDARARAALSFSAGSGGYNSSTGVISIPTNTSQLTNGAGYLTSAVTSVATGNGLTGGTITGTGTLAMSGSYTGNFSATGEITAYSSDKRLKTDLKPIDNALDKVLNLHGVTYYFNDLAESFGFDKTVRHAGLLAQEVKEVMPEVIARAPFDVKVVDGKDTSKSGEDYMTIKYEKLVPLLIEAIKELTDKVETLEAQLSSLKSI